MEELKILVDMVAALPDMAIWVLILYFVYKAFIVGSIYGIIRLAINRMHDAILNWQIKKEEAKNVDSVYESICIRGQAHNLLYKQIARLPGISSRSSAISYIFEEDVAWLKEAIDEKLAREDS